METPERLLSYFLTTTRLNNILELMTKISKKRKNRQVLHSRKHKKFFSNKKNYLLIAVFILIIFVIGIIKKIEYLSTDPNGEKDCPSLFPNTIESNPLPLSPPQHFIPFFQRGGTINDVSCLDQTNIYGIVKVRSIDDIKNAINYAKENKLKVSIAGVRHSMGGQAFAKMALVLDMTEFNQVSVDKENRVVTVQSGALWRDVQNYIHPLNLAVKVMQNSDSLTIGGTISVNAHGADHKNGSIASTIHSLRIMDANGNIQTLSKNQNPQIFKSVIGGYGLFGVIIDAQIELTNNVMYNEKREVINYHDFQDYYQSKIANDNAIDLAFTSFSLTTQSYLKDMIVYTYKRIDSFNGEIPPLEEKNNMRLRRFILNFTKTGSLGREVKWLAEKYLDPFLQNCTSRNQVMGEAEACFISRNEVMYDSLDYTKNNLQESTDILQEYFIPQHKIVPFIDGAREILLKNHTNVIHAGIRVVKKEDIVMNYAPQDMFSLAFYINQKTTTDENIKMEYTTRELINYAISMGGTFYLPYQLYYTMDQVEVAYPNSKTFFTLKRKIDPSELFENKFYLKYGYEKAHH